MRFATIAATLVALIAPSAVLANNTTVTNWEWTSTMTITKTLVLANATTTVLSSTSSAGNWTSASATFSPTSEITSGSPIATFSSPATYTANGIGNAASSDQSSLLIVGMAGIAAVVVGSL